MAKKTTTPAEKMTTKSNPEKSIQKFGGDWTETKLECLKKYILAYKNALSRQKFKKIYIDAFAGSGYRENPEFNSDLGLLSDLLKDDVKKYYDGSAKIALNSDAFDEYYFIEKSRERISELEKLKNEFPEKSEKIFIISGNSACALPQLLEKIDWKSSRAVLFLDPFGLSVKWSLIEQIAETKAIDLWYLFPAMIGRMIHKNGTTKPEWAPTLDNLFGTHDWHSSFTREDIQVDLFDSSQLRQKDFDAEKLADFVKNRLQEKFAGVSKDHLLFTNSKNSPLFIFCFAAANKAGAKIAISIADHIIGKGKSKRGK